MPRELKQGRGTIGGGATPSAVRPLHQAHDDAMRITGFRPEAPPRWFAALDPTAEPRRPPRWGRKRLSALASSLRKPWTAALFGRPPSRAHLGWAAALGIAALLTAVVVTTAALRLALPAALTLAAAWVARRGQAAQQPAPQRAARAVRLDGERLLFESRRTAYTLIELEAPFGVTLLASPRRERAVALLSSAAGTFYLGASFDAEARRAFAPLLDRAYTVAADDACLEAVGPDGEPLLFTAEDLDALTDALAARSPTCGDRFVLTDARGASLTLDGRVLSVGDRAVDLTAPLEWRSIVFQEAFGSAVAVYQGTWVRQGGTELVLVALLPALGPPPGADLDLSTVDRAVLRDLRLMQASPEQPPPAEQRVAIERPFMLPLRSALDRAPRASHQPNRAQA